MQLIDELSAAELERLELDRRSKAMKAVEDDMKARIMQQLDYLGLEAMAGTCGRTASVDVSVEPVVNNWPDFYAYIRKNDALDMLHKRVTVSAVRLRWADGVSIPGVDQYEVRKLKLS